MAEISALTNDVALSDNELSPESKMTSKVHKTTFRLPKPTYEAFAYFRKSDNPLISDSIINAELVNDGLRYRGFTYCEETERWIKA